MAWFSSQTYNNKQHLYLPRLVNFINGTIHVKVSHISPITLHEDGTAIS